MRDNPDSCDAEVDAAHPLHTEGSESRPQRISCGHADSLGPECMICRSDAARGGTTAFPLESRPQGPAPDNTAPGDYTGGSGLRRDSSPPGMSTIDAAACSVVLKKTSFPVDQLTVLNILLPVLEAPTSWQDIDQIVKTVSTDWCRLGAFRMLVPICSETPSGVDRACLMSRFTTFYYRGKVEIILDGCVRSCWS